MRKIDKKLELATAYKKWIDKLTAENKNHPVYSSSKNKYYYDIVANLLWVQSGLCAYTEMFLMNPADVRPENWKNGAFTKFDFMGQLDHYDSKLKTSKGWDWNNFFVVHTDVNTKVKRDKKFNGILKPDKVDYDPFYFLQYDFKTHFFIPNKTRTIQEQVLILEDIGVLGLNYKPIIDYRKEYLKPLVDEVDLGFSSIEEIRNKLIKFYTAFEMSIIDLKDNT